MSSSGSPPSSMKHVRGKRGARRGPPPRAGHLGQMEGRARGRPAQDPEIPKLPWHLAPATGTVVEMVSRTPTPGDF